MDYGNDGLTDHGDDVLAEPGNRSASMNGYAGTWGLQSNRLARSMKVITFDC